MAMTLVDPSQVLAVHANGPTPDESPALVSPAIDATCLILATLAPAHRAVPIRALPLSDAARLERSGVQRI
jgi:hypothetical protein